MLQTGDAEFQEAIKELNSRVGSRPDLSNVGLQPAPYFFSWYRPSVSGYIPF